MWRITSATSRQRAGVNTKRGSGFRNFDLQVQSIVQTWSRTRSIVRVLCARVVTCLIQRVTTIFLNVTIQHARDARHIGIVGIRCRLILPQSIIVFADQKISTCGIR